MPMRVRIDTLLGVDVVRFEQPAPLSGRELPAITFNKVDLPEPQRADHRGHVAGLTENETRSSSARLPEMVKLTSRTSRPPVLVGAFDATDEIAFSNTKSTLPIVTTSFCFSAAVLDAMAVDERAVGAVGVLYPHPSGRRHSRVMV